MLNINTHRAEEAGFRTLKRPWTLLTIAAVLMFTPALVWAAAGQAIFVMGKVTVLGDDGSKEVLKKGGSVDNGDVVVTTAKGHAQIRMADGGMIAVRPNSRFKIDDFEYNGDINHDKSVFSLIKGGFRSVTGAVGQANKKAYKVKTPVATIGIRGTDYVARLCDEDCEGMVNDDGLYLTVLSGGVILTNDRGSVNIDPGEYGHVGGATSDPTLLNSAPNDLLFVKADSTGNQVAANDSGSARQSDSVSANDGSTVASADDSGSDVNASFDKQGTDSATGDTVDFTSTARLADPATSTTVVMASAGSTGAAVDDTASLSTDGSGSLTGFDLQLNDGSQVSVAVNNANSALDTGSDSATGISWGRWSGADATLTDSSGGTTTTDLSSASLHWIAGPAAQDTVTLPTSGTVNYAFVGGTSPTVMDNTTGLSEGTATLSTANLTVDFSAQSVDASVGISGVGNDGTWTGSATGMNLNSDGTYSSTTASVSIGGIPSAATSGTMSGGLVGPADSATGAPTGATVGYTMNGQYIDGAFQSQDRTVTGVAAMQLQ